MSERRKSHLLEMCCRALEETLPRKRGDRVFEFALQRLQGVGMLNEKASQRYEVIQSLRKGLEDYVLFTGPLPEDKERRHDVLQERLLKQNILKVLKGFGISGDEVLRKSNQRRKVKKPKVSMPDPEVMGESYNAITKSLRSRTDFYLIEIRIIKEKGLLSLAECQKGVVAALYEGILHIAEREQVKVCAAIAKVDEELAIDLRDKMLETPFFTKKAKPDTRAATPEDKSKTSPAAVLALY